MAPIRVAVTGSSGQVAYSLFPRIAAGEMFGANQEVDLRLVDIPPMLEKASGVVMELEDGAYPLLTSVSATADRSVGFKDADWVLLVGSRPRGPGMERNDLISANGPIFVDDGKAIAGAAAAGVHVVVVGNPCNTNCLIARAAAGSKVPDDRWSAMTRLDQNRARTMIAKRAGARVRDVKQLVIWGNHSSTLFPDFTNTLIGGKPASGLVDRAWLEANFVKDVQNRGAAIIAARGVSSAFSAAQAIVDHVKSLLQPTAGDDWFSAAVVSDGSYGVPAGLISSFPLRSKGNGSHEIVTGVTLDAYAQGRLDITVAELQKERDVVKDLLA